MIQLIVNGITMDLPTGLKLEREIETTIFNREMEATDFVYPVDLPLTDTNKKALRHPELIAKDVHIRSAACELIIDGIYGAGVMYIESISNEHKTVRVSISGDYGGFWKDAEGKKVNELVLGGVRIIGAVDTGASESSQIADNVFLHYIPCDTADHIDNVINGVTPTDYLFYPALDEKLNIPGLHDKSPYKNTEFLTPFRNYINPYYYNDSGDKGIMDPVKAYLDTHLIPLEQAKSIERYFWVPFFRLAFVLKQCFTELGYSVDSTLLEETNFKTITLYNTYAINACIIKQVVASGNRNIYITHNATQIDPRNHVPKMSVSEFLREIGKNFNLQYIINYATREVRISPSANATPANSKIRDLTGRVNPKYDLSYEDTGYINGYKFNFENDPQDGAIFESTIESITGLNNRGNISSYVDLSSITSPADLDVAFVMAERAWYQYIADATEWVFFGYDKPEHSSGPSNNVQNITSKAVPVPVARKDYLARMEFPKATFLDISNNVIYDRDHLLPYSKLGVEGTGLLYIQWADLFQGSQSDYETAFITVNATLPPYYPHLCNYLGLAYPNRAAVSATHPCGSNGVKDSHGVTRAGIPLYWYGADNQDGLYVSYWKAYVDKITGSVKADFKILWDADMYKDIDIHKDYITINGTLYLVDRVNYVFPFPSEGKIRLVRYG